jgi:hypothetical protein
MAGVARTASKFVGSELDMEVTQSEGAEGGN